MHDFFSTAGFYWSGLEGLIFAGTILFSIYIFFKDPLRRWRFFGYRPTAVIALFDPKQRNILLIKHKDFTEEWGGIQGGIYSNNIIESVEHILEREINLKHVNYRVIGIRTMGSIDISDRYRLKRLALELIGNISITNKLKGKGYIACFVELDFNKAELSNGYHINDSKITSISKAKDIFSKTNSLHINKKKMLLKMLDEIERL